MRQLSVSLILLTSQVAVVSSAANVTAAPSLPAHVEWAERLVSTVDSAHNVYGGHPTYIHWAGVHGVTASENRTVCSSFITLLLRQSYHVSSSRFRAWLGSPSPLAQRYYRAIREGDRFLRVGAISRVRPGDLIAIKYLDHHGINSDGTQIPSGHMLIVVHAPLRRSVTRPVVSGTVQYAVTVIDSAMSGHGPKDTRHKPDGSWQTGVGEGTFRLYARADGHLAGYSWSTLRQSKYFGPASTRRLVIGRLEPSPVMNAGSLRQVSSSKK